MWLITTLSFSKQNENIITFNSDSAHNNLSKYLWTFQSPQMEPTPQNLFDTNQTIFRLLKPLPPCRNEGNASSLWRRNKCLDASFE